MSLAQSPAPSFPSPPVIFDVSGDAWNTDLYSWDQIHEQFSDQSSALGKEFRSNINAYGIDRQAFVAADWGEGQFTCEGRTHIQAQAAYGITKGIYADCSVAVWIRGKAGTQYKLRLKKSGYGTADATPFTDYSHLTGNINRQEFSSPQSFNPPDYVVNSDLEIANGPTRVINGVTYVRARQENIRAGAAATQGFCVIRCGVRPPVTFTSDCAARLSLQVTPLQPILGHPNLIAFGLVSPHKRKFRRVHLTNKGVGVLHITNLDIDNSANAPLGPPSNFSLVAGTPKAFSLTGGQSKEITILCAQNQVLLNRAENLDGTLIVECNDKTVYADGKYKIPIHATIGPVELVNFRKESRGFFERIRYPENSYGTLEATISWESSTGEIADLRSAVVQEVLTYEVDPEIRARG